MNLLDIIIAIPLCYLIFKGYRRGIIFEVASLAGIIVGCILAVRFAHAFATIVNIDGDNAFLVSFFIIFVAAIVLSLFLAKIVERVLKLVHVGFINSLVGALFGLLKGLCIVGVLLYFIAIIDLKECVLTKDAKQSSMLYRPCERTGKKLVGKMEDYLALRKAEHEACESENPK